MQTYPVFFHDWHGIAIRARGHWWISPRQVSDHLGLDWPTQRAKINGSNIAKGGGIMPLPSGRGLQQTLVLKLGYFGHWLLSINEGKVPPAKRELLIAMQDALLDALDRQLARMFGLPVMEAEDLMRLPVPGWAEMAPETCRGERETVLADRQGLTAVQLMRVGLPASRVAPVVAKSIYWARGHQRRCRALGLVPLTPAQQRLLEQPSLFGEG